MVIFSVYGIYSWLSNGYQSTSEMSCVNSSIDLPLSSMMLYAGKWRFQSCWVTTISGLNRCFSPSKISWGMLSKLGGLLGNNLKIDKLIQIGN